MTESQMTEKILTLTLEIICLLTGEDYIIVKKTSGECVIPNSHPYILRGWSKAWSPITELPPHSRIQDRNKEQNILDITFKIIELLTGEVPIRYQDVTVYFSMEEWEYLEGHKDLYKDMIESHQPFPSPGNTNKHPQIQIKEESVLCDGGNLTDANIYTPTSHIQYPSSHIKEEAASCDGGNLEVPNSRSSISRTPLYLPTPIKEKPNLQQEKCISDSVITCKNHTQHLSADVMEEMASCDESNSTNTNIYATSDHSQQPHLTTPIKEEPATQEKGPLPAPDIYTLAAHTQHPSTHIKEEFISRDGRNSTATNIYTSDYTPQYRSTPSTKEPVTPERSPPDPISCTPPVHAQQYQSPPTMGESISCDAGNITDSNIYSFADQLVSVEGENLYKNYGYIFTEHTYTHLNRNTFSLGAVSCVEDLMDSLPHMVRAPPSVEGFSTEAGLAELQYVSNHVRSPDLCPAKAKEHQAFLSKCIEYEKHFCKVSRARICGTHLTEWSFLCSECHNCLNATLKLIRQNLKPREVKLNSVKKTSSLAERLMEKKEFACLQCGKHFPNKRYLLTHRRVHFEENPFHCPACGQSFENQEGFVAHQRNPACEKPFSCSECGKRFKSRYNSEYHKKIHTENKKYLCPVCGKSFRKQSCFIVHERTHTGEKPYACPECGRCFSQNASLISHQRLHTGEKPFKCLECGRNFTQRISLVVHQRVHSGDRPYKCQECGKGFTQRIGLVQHQRRHTGEKPFTCSECGKSFTLHDSLVKHLRTHTGEKPYICSGCGKRFSQSSQLTAHNRFHHATQHNNVENV